MLPREYVLNQINHIETETIPYTIFFEETMKTKLDNYYGNSDWQEGLSDSYLRTVAIVDNIQYKAINKTHSIDAYGSIWRMDSSTWHIDSPALSEPNLKNYKFPDISVFTDPIFRNIETFISNCNVNKDYFKVINMGWGIFERTWLMRGFENALVDIAIEQDFYEELLGRITEIYVESVKACKDIPADAILFGDDWGDQRGIIMGPELWRRFIMPCWEKVYTEVHKQNKFTISHCCGSMHDILDDAIAIIEMCKKGLTL